MKPKMNKLKPRKYKKSKNKPIHTGLDPLIYNGKKYPQKINIIS